MKKQYIKPMIAVEYYELTQSIASCAIKIGFVSSDCVKKDPDATPHMKEMAWSEWFIEGHCVVPAVDMDPEDGLCYHTNANAAFNS